ncbi:MAG: hypothetical protein M1820_008199 [Bogoriella megaspora]|nr:MAG: hypothetical protein M1820_008199 [Bogoriella megaspora]
MSDDKAKCIEYLHENVSAWISTLTQLEKTIDERPKELVAARIPVAPSRKGSNESLRLKVSQPDLNVSTATRSPSPSKPQAPQQNTPSEAVSPAVEPQQQFQPRKRKTGSDISIGGRSGPTKYRSRSLLVVYYDGEVQKSFEQLVRCIGTGRNLIRKGKLAARLEALSDMAADDGDDDDGDGSAGEDDELDYKAMNKIQFTPRTLRTPRRVPSGTLGPSIGSISPPAIYDQLDKALEHTQIMCEKAAHQHLRDGDCRIEIRDAKKSLEKITVLVEPEMVRIAQKKESVRPASVYEPSSPESKISVTKVPSMGKIEVDDNPEPEIEMKLAFPRARANRRIQVEVSG